jgi:hypothetical protein
MKNMREYRLNKYNAVISIWTRWDESYWTSFNIFVLVISLFVAGYAQIFGLHKILACITCSAGIIVSILWLYILNKKYINILWAEEVGKELEKKIFSYFTNRGCFTKGEDFNDFIKNNQFISPLQKKFTTQHSGYIASLIFPLTIIEFWSIMLGVTIGQIIVENSTILSLIKNFTNLIHLI